MNQIGASDLYRWIMRSTTDGLWVFDDSGLTTFANDRLAEILGRTVAEMVGLPVTESLDDAGREQFLDQLQRQDADQPGQHDVECHLVRKDGSRTWALVGRSPLLDDDGVRRGWLHRVTELSDRNPLLDRALVSEQQLADAQAIARVDSWEWDVPNAVVSWSDDARSESTPSPGRVLVAEDNVVNQMVARGLLEGLGYGVDFAQDGLEAVELVTSSPDRFVAVLMDCQMPRLDGLDATRAIREREQPGRRIPIIAMTTSVLLGEQERCLAAGMDDFLVRPVGFELLESTLARWVAGVEEAATDPEDLGDDFGGALDLARVQMLRDLRPGDRSLFEQFVDAFLAKVPEDVAAVEAAVRAGDHGRLVEAAHVLKGSALNLGAAQLGQTCQALEDAGEREDITEAQALLLLLTEQVERASYALKVLAADDQGSALNAS